MPPNGEMGDDLVGGLVGTVKPRIHLTRGACSKGTQSPASDDRHHDPRCTNGPVASVEEADDGPTPTSMKVKPCRPSPSHGSGNNHDVGFIDRLSRGFNRQCMDCSVSGKEQGRDHNQLRPGPRHGLNLSCHPPHCNGPCAPLRLPTVHWIEPLHSCPTTRRARPSPGTGSKKKMDANTVRLACNKKPRRKIAETCTAPSTGRGVIALLGRTRPLCPGTAEPTPRAAIY